MILASQKVLDGDLLMFIAIFWNIHAFALGLRPFLLLGIFMLLAAATFLRNRSSISTPVVGGS